MKLNKYLSLFLVISAFLLCMSVVSANETTVDDMQNEVQQTYDTSTNTIARNDDIKTEVNDDNKNILENNYNNCDVNEINKNTNDENVKTALFDNINLSDIKNRINSTIGGLSDKITAYSGQNFTYSTKLPSIGNNTLNISNVVLKIDGKTLTKTKVKNGVLNLSFTVPSLKPGVHTLTIKAGEGSNAFERNITLNIYKRNVTISADNVKSFAGENITVKANVRTDNFNVILNKAILKISGKTVAKSNVINGIVTFKFKTPNLKKGTYNMVIKTGVNTLYNAANITKKFSVYRNNITIKAGNMTGIAGQKATFKAKFTSDGVKNINNIPSVLKINGISVAKATINDGVGIFYFNVPSIKKGNYDLQVKIGESTFYNSASITKKITVLPQNITVTASPVKGYSGEKVNLVATFASSNNKKVNITKSVLKLNGKTLVNKPVINGVANYSFTIPNIDSGNYTLTIKTGDTTLYSSTIKKTKLTVLETININDLISY